MRPLIFFLFPLALVRAETSEEKHFRDLVHSRSAAEVEHAKVRYERARVVHAACLIQMREKLVPEACYEELTLLSLNTSERAARVTRLDQICLQVARRLNTFLPTSPLLSPACRAEVTEAREIQAYRAGDRPSEWSEN